MNQDAQAWEILEEPGFRLCPESRSSVDEHIITAASWHPDREGIIGIADAAGAFCVCEAATAMAVSQQQVQCFAVYFSTHPVPNTEGGGWTSTPRRTSQAWTHLQFVPNGHGEVVFVQGRSNRVLVTAIPGSGSPLAPAYQRLGGRAGVGPGGVFAFLDGSRIAALRGLRAQVRSLAVNDQGCLVASGDEAGTVCVWLLRTPWGPPAGPPEEDRGDLSDTATRVARYHCAVEGHEGPVFAIAHVPSRGQDLPSMHFATGGIGGTVRLWRAAWEDPAGSSGGPPSPPSLQVQLMRHFMVGGLQTTCLAACATLPAPFLAVGTLEGAVFVFHLGTVDIRAQAAASRPTAGRLMFKLQHTPAPISCVGCARTQHILVTGDSEGCVRMYRPPPASDGRGSPDSASSPPQEPPGWAAGGLPWRLVAECQLGGVPVSLQFSPTQTGGQRHRESPPPEAPEQLLACGQTGLIKCWPAEALPRGPIAPRPPTPPTPPDPTKYLRRPGPAPEGRVRPLEHVNPRSPDPYPEHSNLARAHNLDRADTGSEESEPAARGPYPVPTPHPPPQQPAALPTHPATTLPRRAVSFSDAPQVLGAQDAPAGRTSHQQEGSVQGLSPQLPPVPQPQPDKPRRLRQTWGPKHSAKVKTAPRPAPAATTTEDDQGSAEDGEDNDEERHRPFLEPSVLQQPSLNSSRALQAAIEAKMREEFQPPQILNTPEELRSAARVVNKDPRRPVFQDLVPVSVGDDEVPEKTRKVKKQVSKDYMAKLGELRMTDADMDYPGREPLHRPAAPDFLRWPEFRRELDPFSGAEELYGLEQSRLVPDQLWRIYYQSGSR